MSIKGLKLKCGKIVIEEKKKDLRVRKNYSLPQDTIDSIDKLAEKLGCSSSEAIVEAINIVEALLVEEEPKKAPRKPRNTKKKQEAEQVETTEVEDDDQPF